MRGGRAPRRRRHWRRTCLPARSIVARRARVVVHRRWRHASPSREATAAAVQCCGRHIVECAGVRASAHRWRNARAIVHVCERIIIDTERQGTSSHDGDARPVVDSCRRHVVERTRVRAAHGPHTRQRLKRLHGHSNRTHALYCHPKRCRECKHPDVPESIGSGLSSRQRCHSNLHDDDYGRRRHLERDIVSGRHTDLVGEGSAEGCGVERLDGSGESQVGREDGPT